MEALQHTLDPNAPPALHEEELGVLCRALANPVRVQILRLILKNGTLICRDMVEALPLAQSTVSQHLKVLKEAELVDWEVDGPRRNYRVNTSRLGRFKDLVSGL